MIASAHVRNVKVSARKAGLVCGLIRNQPVRVAIARLQTADKKTAPLLLKLLNSAIANATNNHSMDAEKLFVVRAVANQGPTAKRTSPRARGSADTIKKRTAHLSVSVSDEGR